MAGSPAATTTSVGFWRKSSRSTNAINEGQKKKINRSDDIVSGGGGGEYMHIHIILNKQTNKSQPLLGADFASYIYCKRSHKRSW